MNDMITQAEALQKFRRQLQDLVSELEEQARRTDYAIDEVAGSWKDEQFRKFKREFAEDRQVFEPLCRNLEWFESNPLRDLQTIAERYDQLNFQ